MSFFKRHLVFSVLLGVIVAGTLVLGWFVYSSWSKAAAAAKLTDDKQAELQRFLSLPIYPNRDNAAAVRKELEDSKVALDAMFKLLQSTDQKAATFPAAPGTRTEAYFSLTRFVEEYRAKAEENNVTIGADERFGFSQFANQGPEAADIPQVFQQRYLAQAILDALYKARPSILTGLHREVVVPPAPANADPSVVPTTSTATFNDTFVVPAEVSARRAGFIGTTAFRVQFNGYTNSLRLFLNELAGSPYPIVVRSVDVQSLTTDANKANENLNRPAAPANPFGGNPFGGVDGGQTPEPVEDKPIQIISQNLSAFTVILEYIELVKEPAATAEAPQNP